MDRIPRLWPAALLVTLFTLQSGSPARAFILFEPGETIVPAAVHPARPSPGINLLVQELERITGLDLTLQDLYLRVIEPAPLPLLYASGEMRRVLQPEHRPRWSPTARELLLSAIRSTNVYKVRENSGAALGRVDASQIIELDFADLDRIVYRDLPPLAFHAGMIFLHELVHRHLRLRDPSPEEIRGNSSLRGATVTYINRIERELGLPERRHYAPMKIRFTRDDPKWGIYFGDETDRVEFDARFVVK